MSIVFVVPAEELALMAWTSGTAALGAVEEIFLDKYGVEESGWLRTALRTSSQFFQSLPLLATLYIIVTRTATPLTWVGLAFFVMNIKLNFEKDLGSEDLRADLIMKVVTLSSTILCMGAEATFTLPMAVAFLSSLIIQPISILHCARKMLNYQPKPANSPTLPISH